MRGTVNSAPVKCRTHEGPRGETPRWGGKLCLPCARCRFRALHLTLIDSRQDQSSGGKEGEREGGRRGWGEGEYRGEVVVGVGAFFSREGVCGGGRDLKDLGNGRGEMGSVGGGTQAGEVRSENHEYREGGVLLFAI